MKKEIEEKVKKEPEVIEKKLITRKQAIKKTGFIAVSAATMMILLQSPKAQACSKPGSGDDDDQGENQQHSSTNQKSSGPWK